MMNKKPLLSVNGEWLNLVNFLSYYFFFYSFIIQKKKYIKLNIDIMVFSVLFLSLSNFGCKDRFKSILAFLGMIFNVSLSSYNI